MREYWYIFLAAILCAVFSKQIDNLLSKAIKDSKKRAVLYCVIGAVMLAVIGFFISDIAERYSLTENNVKSLLFRSRNRLREFLKKEGIEV